MIYGQNGASWCSFYVEQSGLLQLIKLRIRWRYARVFFLSELKKVRNLPQNSDIFQLKKKKKAKLMMGNTFHGERYNFDNIFFF